MPGVVSGEMFRNMQNSEIIRRMTEEFDEVTIYISTINNLFVSSNVRILKIYYNCVFMKFFSNEQYCKIKLEFFANSTYETKVSQVNSS